MIEYLPYGETLYDEAATADKTEFRFTSKEQDAETGLYYHGARYRDAKTGVWLSVDPYLANGDYFPVPPVNDKAKEKNKKLPGMGGVFNSVNLNGYHYAGNNPVKYIDPDGNVIKLDEKATQKQIAQYEAARAFIMKTARGKALFEKLEKDKAVIKITFIKNSDVSYACTGSDKGTVFWNPIVGMITGDGKALSPASALAHELGHAEQDLKGIIVEIMKLPKITEAEKLLMIENDNLKKTENPIARELNEGVRKDYYDYRRIIPTVEPTSTEIKKAKRIE